MELIMQHQRLITEDNAIIQDPLMIKLVVFMTIICAQIMVNNAQIMIPPHELDA
jgi:hypothetical protein